ncbi:MAG: glycosyltransferase family 2 protein [Candidatus Goldbacteria bacterium]|nr:glycosyltransferase family 2 protein [Candidatus Goldiibacteriota bacterium]
MKVSVILPVYNGEKFLDRCIKSVLNQSYNNLELIIVDDYSSDNSRDIILKHVSLDKRVKYIFLNKNSGSPALPHNVGFENSTGNFIAYIDQDDEWFEEKLFKQINFYLKTKKNHNKKIGLITCYSEVIDKTKNQTFISTIDHTDNLENIILNPSNYCSGNSSILTFKDVIKDVGGRDETVGVFEDTDFLIRLALRGYYIDVFKEPLFRYYIHDNNFSNRGFAFLNKNKAEKMSVWFENYVIKHHHNFIKKREVLSYYLRGVSIFKFFAGQNKKSLIYLFEAIKTCPLCFKNYFHLILRFLPYLYKLIFRLKYYFIIKK